MKTGTCRELSLEDRREWRVPAGGEAYFIRLPDAAQEMRSHEQIILVRQYDIYTNTWTGRMKVHAKAAAKPPTSKGQS